MDNDWLARMYGCSLLGSLFGLFWPILVALWRHNQARIYKLITPEDRTKFGADPKAAKPVGPAMKFLVDYVLPSLFIFLLALVISVGTSALGFLGFLQDEAARKKLQDLGALAYFAAFSSGFTCASLVAEPMKRG